MSRRRANRAVKPSVATRFPSLSRGPEIDQDVFMFADDIHLALMPISGHTERKKGFTVELHGEEEDCDKAKEIIGSLGAYDRHDTAAMVCDAVDNIARHLAWEGQATYEIVKDNEQIYIFGFTPNYLFKVMFWYLQIIPRGDWNLWNRKFTLIRNKSVWKVVIPFELGGVRGFKRVLRKLGKYSQLGPQFFRRDLERGLTTEHYDFREYARNSEIYVNRVTKKWGWNRRDWSQKNCTEFYSFYKMLLFRHAQALLREHIINEINNLLERLSIKAKLVVIGLPTAIEIWQIKCDMQSGNISFLEASDRAST